MERLSQLYKQVAGSLPREMVALTGSGSNRRYYRLVGEPTLIGVIGESIDENEAFIYLSGHFADKELPVPRVLAVSDDRSAYVQEYLGDTLLFDAIADGRTSGSFSDAEIALLENAVSALPAVQYRGAEGLDFSRCFPVEAFDRRSILWDLNYFKYCYLKPAGCQFSEVTLEDDFERLTSDLLAEPSATFMYRDFQSRNVMVADGRPFFIDFQGGRRGPALYDVASFLWQAKANLPQPLREHLFGIYLDAASQYAPVDRESARRRLDLFVLFRMLQVLGAYGFRGLFEGKSHFAESIAPALANILSVPAELLERYPAITAAIRTSPALQPRVAAPETPAEKPVFPADRLTVTVTSFSYKRGLPRDPSGNGGGFIFDCRGMHNPGRYAEYKPLTGRDRPVIEFLEERGEVQHFLAAAYEMVDPSVATYLRRGFTSLMVSFGCTGGRHRSVYCAEHMAAHLKAAFPEARIFLIHREQNIRLEL